MKLECVKVSVRNSWLTAGAVMASLALVGCSSSPASTGEPGRMGERGPTGSTGPQGETGPDGPAPTPEEIRDALDMDVVEVDDARLTYSPEDFLCNPGEWCTQAEGWSLNRLAQDGRSTECAGEADCSGNAVVLALDDNEHRSVILSHWDSPDSRIIAVELSFDGGATYSFDKAINTRRSRVQAPYTTKLHTIATNLPLGVDVRVRLVAAKGRMNMEGLGLLKVNVPEGDGKPFRSIVWASGNHDDDTCDVPRPCPPTPLADRRLTFVKTQDESNVRIQYTDTIRSFSAGGIRRSCQWEVRFNDASCPSGRIFTGMLADDTAVTNDHQPGIAAGYCLGLEAGVYSVQVYVQSTPGFEAQCFTGWGGHTWLLEAEEVQ